MSKEAIKLALEALEYVNTQDNDRDFLLVSELELLDNAITALREALAEQPSQQCKWPTCQSEEYQQALAEQIKRELVGEQPAQPTQQEPVAWCTKNNLKNMAKGFTQDVPARAMRVCQPYPKESIVLLHTSPPAQRKPLTDGRISWLWSDAHNDTTDRMPFQVFARAIEAAHGIKENT